MFRLRIPFAIALATLAVATPALAANTCVGTPGPTMVKLVTQAVDVRNARGEVAFTVYGDDSHRFLAKHGKLARARIPAATPVTSACFWLKPGAYAVAIYHDENDDHDFNRTLFSIKEGFGFSNDAPTTLGLPSFSDVRFALPQGGRTVRITMRYHR
jgi:uncharacterized protein (DUF2141 family)